MLDDFGLSLRTNNKQAIIILDSGRPTFWERTFRRANFLIQNGIEVTLSTFGIAAALSVNPSKRIGIDNYGKVPTHARRIFDSKADLADEVAQFFERHIKTFKILF